MQQALPSPAVPVSEAAVGLWAYLVVGLFFGLVLVKCEAASWYRMQEMFRLESFHMFGIIGSTGRCKLPH